MEVYLLISIPWSGEIILKNWYNRMGIIFIRKGKKILLGDVYLIILFSSFDKMFMLCMFKIIFEKYGNEGKL